MDYFDHGVFRIPFSIIGLIANSLAMYCLWKTNIGRQFSNADRLLLALILWDGFTCAVIMPYKAVVYISCQPDMKPLFIRYTDIVNNWVSNFLIILVALNRYIKITKPLQYHNIVTKKRIHGALAASLVISLSISLFIFFNMPIMGKIYITFATVSLIVLLLIYRMIIKGIHWLSRSNRPRNHRNLRRNERASKSVFVLLTVYIFCNLCLYGLIVVFVAFPGKGDQQEALLRRVISSVLRVSRAAQ